VSVRTALGLTAALAMCGSASAGTVVTKLAEPFDGTPWQVGAWSKASGSTRMLREGAPDAAPGGCLETEVHFSGDGFEWFSVGPAEPIFIPGDARTLEIRAWTSDPRCGFYVTFRDAWGRTQAGGRKYEWWLRFDEKERWKTFTFDIPREWTRPVAVTGVGSHNWNFKQEARTFRFRLDDLAAATDISDVDPGTGALRGWKPNTGEPDPKKRVTEAPRTPLVSAAITLPAIGGVFSRARPSATVSARNWKPGALRGKVTCTVRDVEGAEVLTKREDVSVESVATIALPLDVPRFGLYVLRTRLELEGEEPRVEETTFARVPPWHDLTEEEKLASPYGVNVHGGKEQLRIEPFRAAGLVWFRDYAWNYDWLLRAKGGDRKYAGWPFYPRLLRNYRELGVKVLPCLMKAIRAPGKGGGPGRAWGAEIASILTAFPEITHWELDNEYDLHKEHAAAEAKVGWRNYTEHHRRFAELVAAIGAGELTTVENGRAGIWPERLRACVEGGDFNRIGVANVHHYCGIDPPEENIGNFNTGFEALEADQAPSVFFDRLRAAKRAAAADGVPRELWLTEFGWDTLAGKVVTPREQAVYLARAWMLAMAAGTEKCFWFFDFDSPTPRQFFDGCGLLDAGGRPKLALCALAGMAHVLKNPRYVGQVNAGDGTWGCVFESDGRRVAALWSVADDDGPEVTFARGDLYDFLGNRLPGRRVRLARAPVYCVGLADGDPLFLQTAYELRTPYMVVASGGDKVRGILKVTSNRAKAISGRVRLALPEAWREIAGGGAFTVEPGDSREVPFSFAVASDEEIGRQVVGVEISERGRVKTIPQRVLVQDALIMQVGPIMGPPGRAEIWVKVGNRSSKTVDGRLELALPASWRAHTPEIRVAALKSNEVRELKVAFDWGTRWAAGETARAVFRADDGRSVERPVIPKGLTLARARGVTLDGNLKDWPAACELPPWILGTSIGEARARLSIGWSEEGLWGAVEARDSRLITADPRSFWGGDCLEIFLDTRDDKRHREFEVGDHQFWVVPQVDSRTVYAGRWKRKAEIPATQYDMEAVRGASARVDGGYVMEFMIPAALMQKFDPRPGARMGLCLNLTVQGERYTREVYWPWTKSDWATANWPKMWGTVELGE
jgi:hypothetical protein